MNERVKLEAAGKTIELPLLRDSAGNSVVSVESLYKETGMFTYDPGLFNTAICKSSITYIDGSKGKLFYRGRTIEELIKKYNYLEVAFLLFNGHIPSSSELAQFKAGIYNRAHIPDNILWSIKAMKKKALPMPALASMVMSYCTYDTDGDVYDPDYRDKVSLQVLGIFPILCSLVCQNAMHDQVDLIQMDPKMSYAANFIHMSFKDRKKALHPLIEKAVDLMLMIHADHEQNASTSSVRFVGSSLTNPFAALCAGICSLWGRSHGGAAIEVAKMIESIKSSSLSVKECVAKAKDKSDPFKLMGFGHRVYKTDDPRAKMGRKACMEMLQEDEFATPDMKEYFKIAEELEHVALNDDYFKDRNLYPNVDFYVGIMLKIIGLPIDAFTIIFVLGRSAGWIAQWREMYEESPQSVRIVRPRQIYTGKLG